MHLELSGKRVLSAGFATAILLPVILIWAGVSVDTTQTLAMVAIWLPLIVWLLPR